MHFTAWLLRSTALTITGLALGFTLWTATAPVAVAQAPNATRMIEAGLPSGTTMAAAGKADLLSAVCAAVRKNRGSAPQIVRVAATARPEWSGDIQRTAFECLGTRDCALLGRVLRAIITANPEAASDATDLANQLAPNCSDAFGGAKSGPGGGKSDLGGGKSYLGDPVDPGYQDGFGLAPLLNQNPPPGSIGGGGAQGNVIAICHNGRTIFVTPRGAEDHLNNHPGDRLGPCQVTPNQNL
jgi:hypothetical protein